MLTQKCLVSFHTMPRFRTSLDWTRPRQNSRETKKALWWRVASSPSIFIENWIWRYALPQTRLIPPTSKANSDTETRHTMRRHWHFFSVGVAYAVLVKVLCRARVARNWYSRLYNRLASNDTERSADAKQYSTEQTNYKHCSFPPVPLCGQAGQLLPPLD